MNDLYEANRDLCLEDGGWNFARKRATMTALTAVPDFGWEHQFTLPTDFIKAWKEDNEEDVVAEGSYLLANASTLYLTYISRIEDTSVYSPGFVISCALRLAASACYTLTQDTAKEDRLEAKYQASLDAARTNDSQSNAVEDIDISEFLGDRS